MRDKAILTKFDPYGICSHLATFPNIIFPPLFCGHLEILCNVRNTFISESFDGNNRAILGDFGEIFDPPPVYLHSGI